MGALDRGRAAADVQAAAGVIGPRRAVARDRRVGDAQLVGAALVQKVNPAAGGASALRTRQEASL